MIASELGLEDMEVAENLKRYPLARVESPFSIRLALQRLGVIADEES